MGDIGGGEPTMGGSSSVAFPLPLSTLGSCFSSTGSNTSGLVASVAAATALILFFCISRRRWAMRSDTLAERTGGERRPSAGRMRGEVVYVSLPLFGANLALCFDKRGCTVR
jgi:hypothetical protein